MLKSTQIEGSGQGQGIALDSGLADLECPSINSSQVVEEAKRVEDALTVEEALELTAQDKSLGNGSRIVEGERGEEVKELV